MPCLNHLSPITLVLTQIHDCQTFRLVAQNSQESFICLKALPDYLCNKILWMKGCKNLAQDRLIC